MDNSGNLFRDINSADTVSKASLLPLDTTQVNQIIFGSPNRDQRDTDSIDYRNRSSCELPNENQSGYEKTRNNESTQCDLNAALVTLMKQNKILIKRLLKVV